MTGKRFKTQDNARGTQASHSASATGSHFAGAGAKKEKAKSNANVVSNPYPQVRSIRLQQVVDQSNREMTNRETISTGEFVKVVEAENVAAKTPTRERAVAKPAQEKAAAKPAASPQPQPQQASKPTQSQSTPQFRNKISALNSASLPRITPKDGDSAAFRKAVITGVSGSMTKIPSSAPARKVSGTNRQYSRYDHGYFDRPDAKQLTDYVAAFQTEPTAGAPAYSWFPFAVYGGISCVVSVAWAVLCVLSGESPLTGAHPMIVAGLVILGLIIACGIVCACATSAATMRKGAFEKTDVWASAVGKSALVLLACLIVWIVCAAIVG